MKTTPRKSAEPVERSAEGGRRDHKTELESFARGSDGTRLYVRQRPGGWGRSLFFCDGILCDGYIYKYLWDDLADHADVVRWNYRGHGRSALPADPARLEVADHALDLDAVRRQVGDPPAILVGHSFGTQVVLEAFRLRPERVLGLVLLCGSFGRVTHTFKGSEALAEALPEVLRFVERHPRLARALWSRLPARFGMRLARLTGDVNLRAVAEADIEPYFRHAVNVDFEMFLRMLKAAGEHSAEDLLAQIEVPVLVIAGERDSFTPAAVSRAMASVLPHARYVELPGGSHVLPLEERTRVAGEVAAFLASLPMR